MTARSDSLSRLDDYVNGILSDEEAADFEAALFDDVARGEDADAVFLAGLVQNAQFLAARGNFGLARRRAEIEELVARGPSVHYIDLGSGGPVKVSPWGPSTELVVFCTKVDLRGYEDIDFEVERPDGTPIKTFRDVSYDPDDGHVYAVCEEPLARLSFGQGQVTLRVKATQAGARREVTTIQVHPTF
jgi:hypothetical protein